MEIISYNELPIINNTIISAIYREAYDKRGVKDYTVSEENAIYYYKLVPYFSKENPIYTKELPKQFQELFNNYHDIYYKYTDTHNTEHRIVKPTSIWYRTSPSGNGSFNDDSISLSGISKKGRNSISITRGNNSGYGISDKSNVGILVLNTLKIKETVTELDESEYTYYPSTSLRKINGWFYPTPVCSGWRRPHLMPYASYDNNANIRVLMEETNNEVFLTRANKDDISVGDEYAYVNFYRNDENYCNVKSWNKNRKDNPNGIIKLVVTRIFKSKLDNEIHADCNAIGINRKETLSINNLYSVVRTRTITEEEY